LPLAVAAGVDFPFLLASHALNRPVPPVKAYRVGVRCRSLRGDLSHLGSVLKGPPAGWTGAFPGRFATLAAIAWHPGRRWVGYSLRWQDPLPALHEALDFASGEWRHLRARMHRGVVPQRLKEAE
jgi:hypothetical protein